MMRKSTVFVPGKIILCGEYAVVFGYPGIALPAPLGMTISFEEDQTTKDLMIRWKDLNHEWAEYLKHIISRCGKFGGTIIIENRIPLGKGMGSSTALIIGICRALLGEDCREKALEIETEFNPSHSGIDFEVIWRNKPVRFVKNGKIDEIDLPHDLLTNMLLLDSGTPDQQTSEMVGWIRERYESCHDPAGAVRTPHSCGEIGEAIKTIGGCADRLQSGEHLHAIIRDHHKAQAALGVVSDNAKKMIETVEAKGGAAKVIGAGGRTGGSGMIFALGFEPHSLDFLELLDNQSDCPCGC